MKSYLAELIGTLALVFIGCGSAVIAGSHIGFTGIAFAFGLVVLALVYAIGPISGCHVNPAITISMLVAGKINIKDSIGYIIAQCIGAIIGAALILAIATGQADYALSTSGLGQNGYGIHSPDQFSMGACFIAEIALTALFLFVIFGSTHQNAPKGFAGISVGLTLAFIHLVGIPITGTSVNPARSLGPALLVGGDALSQLWLFILAPVLGGIIAAFIWKALFDARD
jgi:aquaporin Z